MSSTVFTKVLRRLGYIPKPDPSALPFDISTDKEFLEIYQMCRPFTMTSPERMYALYQAVLYTIRREIPGDFVECGVWKGGSSMVIAMTLIRHGCSDRKIYMYDTYEGMSEPGEEDKSFSGEKAEVLLQSEDKSSDTSIWCYSSIDEVKKNLASTGFPFSNINFVKGKVEDTLPVVRPAVISLLRLDTDWYESTKVELELLYPLLQKGGALIIDDFGHWEGAKKAVMEYFERNSISSFLNRIDYTGRLLIKE